MQVSRCDLNEAAQALVKALTIREKYMAMAMQSFPRTTARFLQRLDKPNAPEVQSNGPNRQSIEGRSLLARSCSHQWALHFVNMAQSQHCIIKHSGFVRSEI